MGWGPYMSCTQPYVQRASGSAQRRQRAAGSAHQRHSAGRHWPRVGNKLGKRKTSPSTTNKPTRPSVGLRRVVGGHPTTKAAVNAAPTGPDLAGPAGASQKHRFRVGTSFVNDPTAPRERAPVGGPPAIWDLASLLGKLEIVSANLRTTAPHDQYVRHRRNESATVRSERALCMGAPE